MESQPPEGRSLKPGTPEPDGDSNPERAKDRGTKNCCRWKSADCTNLSDAAYYFGKKSGSESWLGASDKTAVHLSNIEGHNYLNQRSVQCRLITEVVITVLRGLTGIIILLNVSFR